MTITLKAALSTAGALFVVISGTYTGWGALNEHWALQTEVADMNRSLQLRDNVNYLEGARNLLQYEIKQTNSILQMYQTRALLNDGVLSPSDRQRELVLNKAIDDSEAALVKNKEAIDAMRMAITPLLY